MRVQKIANGAWAALTVLSVAGIAFAASQIAPAVVGMIAAIALSILICIPLFSIVMLYLPKSVQKVGNYVHSIFVDLALLPIIVARYPFCAKKSAPKSLGNAEGELLRPIVLVHGYLHNSSAWGYLRSRLAELGVKYIYAVNLGSTKGSIPEHAETVSKFFQEILQTTQQRDAILIGHSMGGVVSSYYASFLANRDKVKITDVITLGSPLGGTSIAHIGLGASARQMEKHSTFLQELQKKMEQSAIRFYHLSSDSDIIVPEESALPKGATGKSFVGLGHLAFLYSDEVGDEIVEFLTSSQQSSDLKDQALV